MGAQFRNADKQRAEAKFRGIDSALKKAIEDMVKHAENWNEADIARLHAIGANHHIEEAIQKMIDLSDTERKADVTLSCATQAGKKAEAAFTHLKSFQDKSAEKSQERMNSVKEFFGLK